MEKKANVIVVHPERQHSFFTAAALEKQDKLYSYITTVYDKPGSFTNYFKKFIKGQNRKKADSRRCDEIPDNKVVQFYELFALVSLVLIRIPKCKFIYNKWRSFLNKIFAQRVCKYVIENNVDIVIGFDFCCQELFEMLNREAPNVTKILDVSIANRAFMKKNYEKDMMLTKREELKKEQALLWNEKIIDGVIKEVLLADYYFVPSNIVKESLIFCGADSKKIHMIPYGVDVNKFKFVKNKIGGENIKIVYVGQISYRKGIHHLINVIEKYNNKEIEVYIAGPYTKDSTLVKQLKQYKNVTVLGFVTRDKIAELYQSSDVFIFPTLGEGFGLVVLEALSSGLPIICSNQAGGNDAIIDGYNGFVFEAGNDIDMKRKIDWFLDNKEKISKMSENARKSSLKYTWENYYVNINNSIDQVILDYKNTKNI